MECWDRHVQVDSVNIINVGKIKIGDKAYPYEAKRMSEIYGPAYGGRHWNSRPEISYNFKGRMGKQHNIVDIWVKESALIDFKVHEEEYHVYDVLFVLQTDRSIKPLIISGDDIFEFCDVEGD